MRAGEIVDIIESFAPSGIQEEWDNSGMITGDPETEVNAALICLDITEKVMDEAMELGCNMIISHHPLVFSGLKKFSGTDPVSRMVRRAIRDKLVIFSAHTNLDQVPGGISGAMADRIGLKEKKILVPRQGDLVKLTTFIPEGHFSIVSESVFQAGAGHIGNYDSCGFSVSGSGSFRAGQGADPYAGKVGELHHEAEKRFETIFPKHLGKRVISALIKAHPYEEVAYDLYPVKNVNTALGLGIVGVLDRGIAGRDFLQLIKERFATGCIRHSELPEKPVKKVAVMGGSGIDYLPHALNSGADAFITADIKYHHFFNADGNILLMDIGHYESEQLAREVLNDLILKKITNFAVHLSKTSTNPIKYF